MRYRDGRRSVCVSSQSGCPLTCSFCATGQMKFGRNLSADEILDQALHFRRAEAIDHVVFMGMGEPTMNLDAVLGACERLPDLGVTHRRTAISTVGWVPGIDRLAECEMPISLALSLHAPNDGLRSQLMPVNDRYPLAEVLAACERYRARRRRKIFVEYVMLDGVNDLPEHARELAALLDRRVYKVNLIPYNPTGAYDGSSPERIERFRAILAEHGLGATVRLTRGRDIDAACGQLAASASPDRAARFEPHSGPNLDRGDWPASQLLFGAMPAETAVPAVKPPQMSDNPVRRVADDLRAEWRGRGKYPPGPGDFSLARTHQIAHDPLPLLLSNYEEHGPIFSMRLLHTRVVFMLGPGGQPLRHRRPPGELPLARVELRRPDPAARRRPADDRRRLPRPGAGDHDARLPPRTGDRDRSTRWRPRPTRRSPRLRPGEVVDIYDWMRNLAMRIAMRALLGLDPDGAGKGAAAAEHFERALGFYGIDYPLRLLARSGLALAQAGRLAQGAGRDRLRRDRPPPGGAGPRQSRHPQPPARRHAARRARRSPTARSATR